MYNISKKRRGISGLMQVAMIVGIVIIFAGVLFTFAGDLFDVQTATGAISVQKVFLQKVGSDTFVSVNVKNTGNSDIDSLDVEVMVDTDSVSSGVQPFTKSISPLPLVPGMTGSAYAKIVDSADDSIVFSSGQSVSVVINAETADDSSIIEPATVRVR